LGDIMNKHNLMKKIASVATELDVNGFPKEAKKMDLMLLKLAQEEMEDIYKGYFGKDIEMQDNKDIRKKNTNNFKDLTDFLDYYGVEYTVTSGGVEVKGGLWLDNNNLTSLPESFGNLKIGGGLALYSNNLTSLPESFGNLKIGGTLHLGYNKLTSLPESFGNLKIGGDLWLNHNKLTSLPESFGNLKIVGSLGLYNNKLESLPESFGNLKVSGDLLLYNNKLTSFPKFRNLNIIY